MTDRDILRELGAQIAERAALPRNADTVALWKKLNGLRPERPMVMLDQLPWNELNNEGELDCHCTDEYLRGIEHDLRQRLYRYNHFTADMVMHAEVYVHKTVHLQTGLRVDEITLATDPDNAVRAHAYHDQIPDDEALGTIPEPVVSVDEDLDHAHLEQVQEILDGLLPVRLVGPMWQMGMYAGMWDMITQLRGVELVLYDMADRPDFTRRMIAKFAHNFGCLIDQYEAFGLFDADAPLVHCTGAYTDELPSPGFDGAHVKARDVWAFGLAQVFSTVSPQMHLEYEIEPMKPYLERFGLVYYGCCDPLDRKVDIVRRIGNVRKISMSPWADTERGAEAIGHDFVFSAKPNPSHVAMDRFDEELIRAELRHIVSTCARYGTPCELILKDISTVRYEPWRLTEWERIAMEEVTRNL